MKKIFVLLLLSLVPLISLGNTQFDIAYTLYAEAAGEGQIGICYVASVIHNRSVEQHRTYTQIIKMRKQFSCWNNVTNPKPRIENSIDQKVWEYCNILARDMCNGTFKPFISSNHYYNPDKCSPSWGTKMMSVIVYKNHRFGQL